MPEVDDESGTGMERKAEEDAKLVQQLRASLQTLAEDNNDLREYNATLKKAQKSVLERLREREEEREVLMREKADLASETARLRAQEREARATAEELEAQVTELRRELEGLRLAESSFSSAMESAVASEVDAEEKEDSEVGEGGGEESGDAVGVRERVLRRQVLALRRALFDVSRLAAQVPDGALALERVESESGGDSVVKEAVEAARKGEELEREALEPPPQSPAAVSSRLQRHRQELGARLNKDKSKAQEEGEDSDSSTRELQYVPPPENDSSPAADALFGLVFAPSMLVASSLTLATDTILGIVGVSDIDD